MKIKNFIAFSTVAIFIIFSGCNSMVDSKKNESNNSVYTAVEVEEINENLNQTQNDVLPEKEEDETNNLYAIPNNIYVELGCEINLYYQNIMWQNHSDYYIDIQGEVGKQMSERWTFTPESDDIGNHIMQFNIYDSSLNLIKSQDINVCVTEKKDTTMSQLKILVIGDSLTTNGFYISEITRMLTDRNIEHQFIGTQGEEGYNHEGYNGWTVDLHLRSQDSPFVHNGKFDFAEYLNINNFEMPDLIIINLGTNDIFSQGEDRTAYIKSDIVISELKEMLQQIQEISPDTHIGICTTVPPSGNQDAFGYSYGLRQTLWRYARNNIILNDRLVEEYEMKHNSNVGLIPVHINYDTVNNAKQAMYSINSRTDQKELQMYDGVHPDTSGYYQIADSIFYYILHVGTYDFENEQ